MKTQEKGRVRRDVREAGLEGEASRRSSPFCQILTQSHILHKREVDIAGNGKRPAEILLTQWDGQRDLAVDLTISHPNPAGSRPARFSGVKVMKDKEEKKNAENGPSCERAGMDFSPMVMDTWGDPTGRARPW